MAAALGMTQVENRPGMQIPPFLVEDARRWRQALPRYGKLSVEQPTEKEFREETRRADAIAHGRIAEIRSYNPQHAVQRVAVEVLESFKGTLPDHRPVVQMYVPGFVLPLM